MPKVSVIIPTYNRASFLRSAIASVLKQTFQDFELLVVDNGSEDNSHEVVESFADERIKYLRIEVNNGVSPARNLGITRSRGEYVAFLDDDDEWLPEKLELQVRLMQNSPANVAGVYTGLLKVDRASGLILDRITPAKRGNLFVELCIGNCIDTASTVLLRKECVMKAGLFDEDIRFGEDYDLWIRVAKEFHFDFIPTPLVLYSIHANNANSNYQKVIVETEIQLKKHRPLLDRKALSHRYMRLGDMYCYGGDAAKGRKALLTAIRLYPFEIKHYYNLCLAFFGPNNFKRFKQFKGWVSSRLYERVNSPSRN